MPVFVSFARFINRTYSAVIPCIRSHLPHHRIESRFDTISDKAQDCKLFFHFCAIFCAPLHICPKCTNNTGYRPFFQAGGCFLPAEKRDDRRGRPAGGAERPAVSPAGRTKCGRAYSAGFFRAGAVRPQPDISPPGGPGLFGCSRPPRFAARTPRRTPRPFAASRHPGPRMPRRALPRAACPSRFRPARRPETLFIYVYTARKRPMWGHPGETGRKNRFIGARVLENAAGLCYDGKQYKFLKGFKAGTTASS